MKRDDTPATLPQAVQSVTGHAIATAAAVRALLLTHPQPERLRAAMREAFHEMDRFFVTGVGLQGDAGMRAAYADLRRSFLAAAGDTE